MHLHSDSFKDGHAIPGEFAFCVIDAPAHVRMSANRNPHLAWDGVPAATKSLALVCHDPDVPSRGDDVNQEGKSVPADLPRVDFFHWGLIDMPADMRVIAAGQFSDGITPHGKPGPVISAAPGLRHAINDYTSWFAGDAGMAGDYFGYDGPCPPWNDSIPHHYVFTVYALDIDRLPLEGKFTGQQVRDALAGHVLAQASLTGVYSLNPALATA